MAFPLLAVGVGAGVLGFMTQGSITQIINIYYSFLASAIINAVGRIKNECITIGSFQQIVQLSCDNPGELYVECLKESIEDPDLDPSQCSFYTENFFAETVRALCTGGTINQTMGIRLVSECIIDNTADFESFQQELTTSMNEARELFENFDFDAVLEQLGSQLDAIETPSLSGWQQFTGASVTQVTDLHDSVTEIMNHTITMDIVNSFIVDLYAAQKIEIQYVGFDNLNQTMALSLVARKLVNLDQDLKDRVEEIAQVAMDMNELKDEVQEYLDEKESGTSNVTVLVWVLGSVGVIAFVALVIGVWVFAQKGGSLAKAYA